MNWILPIKKICCESTESKRVQLETSRLKIFSLTACGPMIVHNYDLINEWKGFELRTSRDSSVHSTHYVT